MRTRQAFVIDGRDQARIAAALERWPEQEGFIGYRTRAFVYLLWDGALRTGSAICLNVEEVLRDSEGGRLHVADEATMRQCGGSKDQPRSFAMTDRTRCAIADYLKLARIEGALVGGRLKGPLWIASKPHGAQKRMSQRTAVQAWHTFISGVKGLSRDDFQLDDVVLTGRVAFAQAANASWNLISAHAGIGSKAAARYSEHLPKHLRTREVLSRLNRQHRRQ
jgi:hypothetical protein